MRTQHYESKLGEMQASKELLSEQFSLLCGGKNCTLESWDD